MINSLSNYCSYVTSTISHAFAEHPLLAHATWAGIKVAAGAVYGLPLLQVTTTAVATSAINLATNFTLNYCHRFQESEKR